MVSTACFARCFRLFQADACILRANHHVGSCGTFNCHNGCAAQPNNGCCRSQRRANRRPTGFYSASACHNGGSSRRTVGRRQR